jgi:hypothetical protein
MANFGRRKLFQKARRFLERTASKDKSILIKKNVEESASAEYLCTFIGGNM